MAENRFEDSKVFGQDRVGWLKKKSRGLFPRWQRRFARISEDFLILMHNPSSSHGRRYKITDAQAANQAAHAAAKAERQATNQAAHAADVAAKQAAHAAAKAQKQAANQAAHAAAKAQRQAAHAAAKAAAPAPAPSK